MLFYAKVKILYVLYKYHAAKVKMLIPLLHLAGLNEKDDALGMQIKRASSGNEKTRFVVVGAISKRTLIIESLLNWIFHILSML